MVAVVGGGDLHPGGAGPGDATSSIAITIAPSSPSPQPHEPQSQPSTIPASKPPTVSDSGIQRQRLPYPLNVTSTGTSTLDEDIKDTQLVSPSYDQQTYQQSQAYPRSRSPLPPPTQHHPSHHHPSYNPYRSHHPHAQDEDNSTTLSAFLHNMFLSAKQTSTSRSAELSSYLSGNPPLKADATAGAPEWLKTGAGPEGEKKENTLGFVALCACWYLSSAVSSNTGKSILTRFRYPVTLTFVQFAFVAGYCVLFLSVREQLGNRTTVGGSIGRRGSLGTAAGWGIKKPSRSMFQGTLMMSLFQIAGHVFSSMAIARVPVSTVHTIKALSPLFTVASYAVLFRVRYSPPTYVALLPLTLGVMLACSFDLRANAFGFLCALGSTIIFVSQNIFSKKLLPKDTASSRLTEGGRLDKLNLLFYSSGMAFFLMIPIWLYTDGSSLFSILFSGTAPLHSSSLPPSDNSTLSLVLFFLLNGTVHFFQNLIAFSILSRTSPVTYSIASLIKRIAVICLAILWSHQSVSFVQGVGMGMTFVGLGMYNRAKGDVDRGERKRASVEKRGGLGGDAFLPTNLAELSGSNTPVPFYHQQREPLLPTSMGKEDGEGGMSSGAGAGGGGGGVTMRKGSQGPPSVSMFEGGSAFLR